MRKFYTLLFTLALPLVLLRLYWRGFKAPQYRRRWAERLGFYACPPLNGAIWFHTVSVGEAEAAFPLIKRLLAEHPDHPMLVTSTTPTGSARIRAVLGDQVSHVYLPYDLPWIVARFLRQFRPRLAVFLEKEVWPNLFAACAAQTIPLYIINARLSARSARGYRKISALMQPALACVSLIATQTADDKRRFIDIGAVAERVEVVGNLKYDLQIDSALLEQGRALKQQQFSDRSVWIVASSHQDEEAQLLPVYRQLKQQLADLLLVIAPRHPERFATVASLCVEQGCALVTRSSHAAVTEATDVYLADSLGELKLLYAASDVAFVAGSLVAVGGHNVLEPAALGVPVLFGPWMFNFQQVAEQMLQAEAARQCADAEAVGAAILDILHNPDLRQSMAQHGQRFVQANQGATQRIAAILGRLLTLN